MANKYFFPFDCKKASWNNQITPQWDVTEQHSASGRYRAFSTQLLPSYTFTYTFPCLTDDELAQLLGFFNARKGTFQPFFFTDSVTFKCEKQRLARVDNSYPLLSGLTSQAEQVFHAEDVNVYVNGNKETRFTLTDGTLTIPNTNADSVVEASYVYYFRVKFSDSINITNLFYNANRVTVKFKVVR